jgi:hypothetical protein
MLTIESLSKTGGLVSDKPVKKHIKFKIDGSEHEGDIYVSRVSIGVFEQIFLSDDKLSRTAKAISAGIRLGDGSETLSFEQAYQLHPSLASAMLECFYEVNGASEKN